MLVSGTDVPIGPYEWMRLRIDTSQSYMDLASTGARHTMQMGDRYELHSVMRLINLENAGGLSGMVAASMIDINHPDCDSAPGGNWACLFPGGVTVPDDIANIDSDAVCLGPSANASQPTILREPRR